MDHTNTDIGENSAIGSCSATASYGSDGPDSDYTTTSDAETQDSDAEGEGPRAAKKQRRHLSGSAKYSSSYQSAWEKAYDFVARSSSKAHFFCKVCHKDVSIKHQGALDIKRHSEGKIHKQRALSARSQARLSFISTKKPIYDKATAVEVRNTVMIAHHNFCIVSF